MNRGLKAYSGGFYFRHGGRCGSWCPTENNDKRRRLVPKQEGLALSMTLDNQDDINQTLTLGKSSSANGTYGVSSHISEGRTLAKACTEQTKRIFFENFEKYKSFRGWNPIRRSQTNTRFTDFLGRFGRGTHASRMIWNVPGDFDEMTLQFTFFEIDNWNAADGDSLEIQIAGCRINVGKFDTEEDEGFRKGYHHDCKINWSMKSRHPPYNIGFGGDLDQQHRFAATFPRSLKHFRIKFIPHLSSKSASAGFDNVRVVAYRSCRLSKSFSGFKEDGERRMRAEIQHDLYQEFYNQNGHCMNRVMPRVDLQIIEESNYV
eukprot:CAMPEP_0202452464 /NCGR_PEP_ID=MMETSP1360-20130828/10673_1 /ASSEMBLY_ACC=CAM_ASM_000848 /TAXON_ID=515479 /ORGANISM="Licmophora paradoxa, Strain CCMP2313" /LENGTH=317 /DNA_ID=CAMNT_0049071299 /DNA_START=67 /DNA_END=1016 /DNA_ORIENTATION=+